MDEYRSVHPYLPYLHYIFQEIRFFEKSTASVLLCWPRLESYHWADLALKNYFWCSRPYSSPVICVQDADVYCVYYDMSPSTFFVEALVLDTVGSTSVFDTCRHVLLWQGMYCILLIIFKHVLQQSFICCINSVQKRYVQIWKRFWIWLQ